jgi:hypothetical protein
MESNDSACGFWRDAASGFPWGPDLLWYIPREEVTADGRARKTSSLPARPGHTV